ncbi:MAG TPA: hypothetical protein VIJ94_10325 [Caulobacteraceae bacterium]
MAIPVKHKGAVSELLATAWLLDRGYEVFRNVSQHGPADLVGWRPGEPPELFDVKTVTMVRSPTGRIYANVSAPAVARATALGIHLLYADPGTGSVSTDPADLAEQVAAIWERKGI